MNEMSSNNTEENEALVQHEENVNSAIEDHHSEQDGSQDESLGFWAVIFLTVNATLGAGMLNIPYAFVNSGGIVSSSVLHSIHLILVVASLVILSYLCRKSSTKSFQSLTKYYCGSLIATLTSVSILLYSFGSSVTYLLIIRDQVDKVFGTFYPASYNQYWYFNGNVILFLIAFITILPLCCSKDISFLKYASFLGFLCTFYLTFLVVFEYIKLKDNHLQIAKLDEKKHRPWTVMFNILPVLTFSYQCQLSWIPTYVQVKRPTNKAWIFLTIFISMIVCFFSYTSTAVFGLLTFGSCGLNKDIMENYDPDDIFVSTAMVLLILKTIVLFPVIMYVGRIALEDFLSLETLASEPMNQTILRIIVSTVWVLSSTLLAIYVPNIAVAIDYLGSLANLFVFILPGLILYKAILYQYKPADHPKYSSSVSNSYLYAAILFVGYGIFIMSISVHQTLFQQPDDDNLSLKSLFYKQF